MAENITFYNCVTNKINKLLSDQDEPVPVLASILSCSEDYARSIISGKEQPRNTEIFDICSYFNITIDDFLSEFGVKE